MKSILVILFIFLFALFAIYMFERGGATMVINASIKKLLYSSLKNKFNELKYHQVEKILYRYNNQEYYYYYIYNPLLKNSKTIFRFHPILNSKTFVVLNHLKDYNMIAFEIKNSFKSIYQFKDCQFKLFQDCIIKYNLDKKDVFLHSSCAYTNLVLELSEKYPNLYNKVIIEEPMIDFHKIINRSIKQIRFITPLLSKKLYPDCVSKIYKIDNPILILISRQDKITNMKDCLTITKYINSLNLKCKFIDLPLESFLNNINDKKDKRDKSLRRSYKFRGTHANLYRSKEYLNTLNNYFK